MKGEVLAVAVKLPTFWTTNPRAWFVQADAQFAIRGVTEDQTKYYYVVAALDQDTATRCAAVLERPPASEKYRHLKEFLTQRFELSPEERGDRLLEIRALGDRRPSDLMDSILQLNGSAGEHFILRCIFMRALPPALRNALATSTTGDMRDLAREADRALSSTMSSGASLCSMEEVSSDWEASVNAMGARQLCKYHAKFGVRARRCVPPCDWKPYPPGKGSGNGRGGPRP
jgi:hypothetical protein